MGSGRRMCRTQLWLLAFLVFSSHSSLANQSQMEVMSAPNLLRVGTTENIFVEIQDCQHEHNIDVKINVMNHPTKSQTLKSTTVTLSKENKFQALGQITIPAKNFRRDRNMKHYVYLQAEFPDRVLEKVVLVSFQSGYIFIQTDKTLYTPNSNVFYRIFALRPGMEPVERDSNTQTDASISIEIVAPGDIIAETNLVTLMSGIYSGGYKLNENVIPGLWKVVAKFSSNLQQSFAAEFEVKEYVLPSFEVKLTPVVPFFYVDSPQLTVNIKAAYLFKEEVDGAAYVIFGVIHEGHKQSFSSSLQRVPIVDGKGAVTLKREHITQTFNDVSKLVGSSIYVAVSVLTDSGSEMVEAELRNIQIVTSPYRIYFKKTPKYFKPGINFNVAVEVMNPDDTPAQGVAVVVDPGQVQGLTAPNGMAMLTVNTLSTFNQLTVTARTNSPGILHERQASATMVALPHSRTSNNFIHIVVESAEVTLGNNLRMQLIYSQQNHQRDITYLILTRGQLVKYYSYKTSTELMISKMVPITKEMLPSIRIIAYYHTNENEVVSDSVWLDVKDSCMGSLKLEPTKPSPSYVPGSILDLRVTGDPEATVGLVAVDKGVYVLNNKHRLTQKKVWDVVEQYDTGCTPGGGKDSMGVFYDAGLLFESSTASGTPYRQDLKCPTAPSRRKRDTTIMDVRSHLLRRYEDKLQIECCLDGMNVVPNSYSCERRCEYIVDGSTCVEAFLHCCKEMEMKQAERRVEYLKLARSEVDESYMNSDEIVSRTKFPESWLWSDIILPACPIENPNCGTTSYVKKVSLQDSITTWQFTGISLSRTHGICVADPLEITVQKSFFIDLRLPYSAVRGEQLEIKAILHNYKTEDITVRVDLIEEPHLCSAASKRGKYRQEVEVGSETTRSLSFIIIPMKKGRFPIEVKAVVKDSFQLSDGIRKMLWVVPQGVLKKSVRTIKLDPGRSGINGTQNEVINSEISLRDLAPDTPLNTLLSLTGREQMSTLIENAISGNSMGTLIQEPHGCGEQNLASMTLPVIATIYLDKTNQWENVGFDERNKALQHIKTGYQNELYYRKSDGSFTVFRFRESSTWLTAYVVKVFSMARSLVKLDDTVICDALEFLILKTWQDNGVFTEVGYVFSYEMRGDVHGTDSDASMTAFCLIAIQESRSLCAETINKHLGSIDKSVAYLETRLPHLTNPYAVAMTSYALANENKLKLEILRNFASSDFSHWPVPKANVYTLEATAYALLALVKAKAFEEAKPVVRWFSQQQKVDGGYGSTQATIMVYQAVAEYWANAEEPEYNLNVNLLLPDRMRSVKYSLNKGNHHVTITSKFKSINRDVSVQVTGKGEAMLTMVSLYYALPEEKESDCQKFNLSVELIPVKMDKDEKVYKLIIEVLFKDRERNASMSILDIGLPTGFTANTNDLDLLSKGRARSIAKYEMNTVLSERGSLIIYLEKVSHTLPEEITFKIHQKMEVGILQPAAVSVYEYYDKTHCVKFYHPQRISGELLTLCRNEVCVCAEENCSMQRKDKIRNEERTEKACEVTATSKIDFAYKVRVENITEGRSTDVYTVRIMEVIKEGNNDKGPLGELRPFLSYPQCRRALDMRTGKTYLIMGRSKDISSLGRSETYQYVLGEKTWIEYWPTEAECQTKEHRHTCLGMERLVWQHTIIGCEE